MGEAEVAHGRRHDGEQVATILNASPPEERIESLDAIRGVALFGVLMVNLVTEFRVSIFEQFLPGASPQGPVERIVAVGMEQKAFCLFSLLFGVGLAIQFERLAGLYWLARRMAVLLLFGLLHLLFLWNGDILTEYAVAGAIVLPLLLLPLAALPFAVAVFLLLYLVGSGVVQLPNAAALRAHVVAANEVYANGSWPEIWRFGLDELPLIAVLHAWVLPRTIALFLLGVFVWRAGLFRRAHEFMDEIALVAIIGIAAGAALTVARMRGSTLPLLAPVILALGYGAALVALAQWPAGARLLAPFARVGRMAFTNYLMQSVVFCLVFFGYGLGQFGRMGAATAFALGVLLYAAQVAISRWWLARFRFGPVEWVWRTMMYGRVQSFRR